MTEKLKMKVYIDKHVLDICELEKEITRLTKQLNACIEDNKHLEKENRGLKDKLKGRGECCDRRR